LPTNALIRINGQIFLPTIINTGGVYCAVSLIGLPPGVPWEELAVIDPGTSYVIATLPIQSPLHVSRLCDHSHFASFTAFAVKNQIRAN